MFVGTPLRLLPRGGQVVAPGLELLSVDLTADTALTQDLGRPIVLVVTALADQPANADDETRGAGPRIDRRFS